MPTEADNGAAGRRVGRLLLLPFPSADLGGTDARPTAPTLGSAASPTPPLASTVSVSLTAPGQTGGQFRTVPRSMTCSNRDVDVSTVSTTWPQSAPAALKAGHTSDALGVVSRRRSPASDTPLTSQAAEPRLTTVPEANARDEARRNSRVGPVRVRTKTEAPPRGATGSGSERAATAVMTAEVLEIAAASDETGGVPEPVAAAMGAALALTVQPWRADRSNPSSPRARPRKRCAPDRRRTWPDTPWLARPPRASS